MFLSSRGIRKFAGHYINIICMDISKKIAGVIWQNIKKARTARTVHKCGARIHYSYMYIQYSCNQVDLLVFIFYLCKGTVSWDFLFLISTNFLYFCQKFFSILDQLGLNLDATNLKFLQIVYREHTVLIYNLY